MTTEQNEQHTDAAQSVQAALTTPPPAPVAAPTSGADLDVIYRDGHGLVVYETPAQPHIYSVFQQSANPAEAQTHVVDLVFKRGTNPGLTTEALLTVLMHRNEGLNNEVYSDDTKAAIRHMLTANRVLQARTANRQARGVEGTQQA